MKLILNLVEMNEIDFEFIFYHSSLIWLNLNAIYFMVTYSDFFFFFGEIIVTLLYLIFMNIMPPFGLK